MHHSCPPARANSPPPPTPPQGMDSPWAVWAAPRLVHSLLAVLTDLTTARFASRLFGARAALPTLALSLTAWFHWYSLPRPLANSLETALLAAALALWPWNAGVRARPPALRRGPATPALALALLIGGLACAVRPTAALAFAPLGVDLLCRQSSIRAAGSVAALAAACVAVAVAASAAADSAGYGALTWSPANFAAFNVVSGLSRLYGETAWWFGGIVALPVVLGAALPLIAMGAVAALWRGGDRRAVVRRAALRSGVTGVQIQSCGVPEEAVPLLAACLVVLGLCSSPHVEFRFLHPVLPLLLPYAGVWVAGTLPQRALAVTAHETERLEGSDPGSGDRASRSGDGVGSADNDRADGPVMRRRLARDGERKPKGALTGRDLSSARRSGGPHHALLVLPVCGDVDAAEPLDIRLSPGRRKAEAPLWRPGGFAIPSAFLLAAMVNVVLAIVTGHVMKTGPAGILPAIREELTASERTSQGAPPPMTVHVWGSCHAMPGWAALHVPVELHYFDCSPGARLADDAAAMDWPLAANRQAEGLAEIAQAGPKWRLDAGGSVSTAWFDDPHRLLKRLYGDAAKPPAGPGEQGDAAAAGQLAGGTGRSGRGGAGGDGSGDSGGGWLQVGPVSHGAVTGLIEADTAFGGASVTGAGLGLAPRVRGVTLGSLRLPSHVVVWSGSLDVVREAVSKLGYERVGAAPHNPIARLTGADRSAGGEDIDETSAAVVLLRHASWGAWAKRQGLPDGSAV